MVEAAIIVLSVVVAVQIYRIVQLESKIKNANFDFAYVKGKMEQFMAAPVLRQYIERNVPILMTREQEEEAKRKMAERAAQWQMSLANELNEEPPQKTYPERESLFSELNSKDLV